MANAANIEIRLNESDLKQIAAFNANVVALLDPPPKCVQYWEKLANRCTLHAGHAGEHVFGFPESQIGEIFDERQGYQHDCDRYRARIAELERHSHELDILRSTLTKLAAEWETLETPPTGYRPSYYARELRTVLNGGPSATS